MAASASKSEEHAAVLKVIHSIPAGKVASYGQVAELAGLPGRARWVGRVLSQLPTNSKVPWYRVINASGRISFPAQSRAYETQRKQLEAEGVVFSGDKIRLSQFRWNP